LLASRTYGLCLLIRTGTRDRLLSRTYGLCLLIRTGTHSRLLSRTYGLCLLIRTGTRAATVLILRTRTLSDMDALDKRLYTSHHATTDSVSRLEQDRVKLACNGCCWPSVARLSLLRYCTHTPHPCTVLTAAHHTHTRPPDAPARIASPQSLSNTYSSLELRSSPRV
jgi:hypothetical protein